MIRLLQKRCALCKIEGALVFDGRVRHGEESGRSYYSPLEVIYTSRGQSADAYILELIQIAQNPRLMVVVTNDRFLLSEARALGAKTMGNGEFLRNLSNRKKKKAKEKPEVAETKHNIERLLKIFEEGLQKEEDY